MTNPDQPTWNESDSALYREIAPVAVPARPAQIASLLTLLPFNYLDSFTVTELGCGEGLLSAALLACFPGARLLALDGSAEMRALAAQRLDSFGGRARVEAFDLGENGWHSSLSGAGCVLSSLCLHHLPGPAKQALFATIHRELAPGGALLIADLVEPQHPAARNLFAGSWESLAQVQSLAQTGSTGLFDKFREARWNHYDFPDPVDQPSPLFDQLLWLRAGGFTVADCFWLQAGHAIYGGYKSPIGASGHPLPYETALAAAQAVCQRS